MPPHCHSVLLATNGKGHNTNGQGLLVLPARQGSQTRPPPTSRDTGSSPPFRPHPRQPGRPPAALRGHTYLFTIIDKTSRWPEAIPLSSITAADCARALFAGRVSRFGVPATITSDRGAQFTSALWSGLCSLLKIQHSPTTAYHPQSNRLVERFHRWLKDALRSWAAAADWHDHLPWVMQGIKASFREDSEFSPAEAVFGS
jgi:transposase InsO family protein